MNYRKMQKEYPGFTAVAATNDNIIFRLVSILEKKGLVKKVATGSNMYRAKLMLTEEGRLAAQHVRQRAAVAVELAGSGLTEEERETFYRALELITENLQKLGKEGLPQR